MLYISKRKSPKFLIPFIFFAAAAAFFVFYRPPNEILVKIFAQFERPFIEDLAFNIIQTRTSFQKTANIVHFPYWFKKTELPIYEIIVDPKDLKVMNDNLPENVYTDTLQDENKVFVKALFKHENYESEIELRYRGLMSDHWAHAQRSLLVKFPPEKLFGDIKAIDLIIPRDRGYLIEIINNERLAKAGLSRSDMFFVWLKINGKDVGVYLAKERYSKEWLEKNAINTDSEVFSQTADLSPAGPYVYPQIPDFGAWRRDINEETNSFEEMETLFAVMQIDDDEKFYQSIEDILDLEKWYKAIAINVLANGAHSMEVSLNLIHNKTTGKLEPLLEDINIFEPEYSSPEATYKMFGYLTRRILANEKFYNEYIKVLEEMSDEENLKKDLALYDELYETLKPEFYKDQSKHRSDFEVDKTIKKIRGWIKANYEMAQNLSQAEWPIRDITNKQELDIYTKDMPEFETRGSYKHFFDISKTPQNFVRQYPTFKIRNGNIALGPGNYVINQNIIVPKNTKLIINAGTKIYMEKGVSIISYSPVEVIGKAANKIVITRSEAGRNWGSVAILNSKGQSVFDNVTMVGGSLSDTINGVTFTGMLSVHNAPIIIKNSYFSEDSDDDIINIKETSGEIHSSKFENSNGDAVDLDMTKGFTVENNEFVNIGGDAIDLSFSDSVIIKNRITTCSDKGISVGEVSTPTISGNTIKNCVIGIAVKDKSVAKIENNTFIGNNEAISLYQKKAVFGPGEAILKNNVFKDNGTDIKESENSAVINL